MMIVKVAYSKLIILSLLFGGLIISCNSVKNTLKYESTFKGYGTEGVHSRALFANDKMVIIGGMDGHLSMNFFDTTRTTLRLFDQAIAIEDFRDVHCTQRGNCIFMNSGKKGLLYGVSRSGQKMILYDTANVFLDGLAFWDEQNGIVYGDPIDGRFFLAKTYNKGKDWEAFTPEFMPLTLTNEAGFAASGTGIQTVSDSTVYIGTGVGQKARLFCSYDRGNNWVVKETPLKSGDSYGIYSMYFWSKNEGVIFGGSYIDSTYNENICQYTSDGGNSWESRSKGIAGYCSAVHGTKNGNLLVATGRVGTFYSVNKGKNWYLLTKTAYYSCFVTNTHIVLSGKNGILEYVKYSVEVS